MYCPNCGKQIDDDAAMFCPDCGASLPQHASSLSIQPIVPLDLSSEPPDFSASLEPSLQLTTPLEPVTQPTAPIEPSLPATSSPEPYEQPTTDWPVVTPEAVTQADAAASEPGTPQALGFAPVEPEGFTPPGLEDVTPSASEPTGFVTTAPEGFTPWTSEVQVSTPQEFTSQSPTGSEPFSQPAYTQTPSGSESSIQATAPFPAPDSQTTAPFPAPSSQAAPTSQVAPPPPAPGSQATPPAQVGFSPQAPAQPVKKKSRTPMIVGILAIVLVLLIGGGFGVYTVLKSNRYETAIDTYEKAQLTFNNASNVAAYQNAKSLYEEASVVFIDLGEYKEAVSYASKCSNGILESQKNIDYLNALALFDAGDYKGAMSAFELLGNFKDSQAMIEECNDQLDFAKAIELFDSGDYAAAQQLFKLLSDKGFPDADNWQKRATYAIAEGLLNNGQPYEAFKVFKSLGSYEDAADRAQACTTPYPDTGEVYHDGNYYSSAVRLNLDGNALTTPRYIKIYSGDTLVASLFINPYSSTNINLPSGTYTIKSASGTNWFGPDVMFGDEGFYFTMTFENDSTSVYMQNNYIYTLTLNVTSGNVGSVPSSRDDF